MGVQNLRGKMASLLCRSVYNIARRSLFTSSSRMMGSAPAGGGSMKEQFPEDPEDPHSVGPEKWENLTKQKYGDDPYDWSMAPHTFGQGTKDNPKQVPSIEESRLVGCLCEEEDMHIKWMTVYKGAPRRCACGFWFKVVEPDYAAYPEYPDIAH